MNRRHRTLHALDDATAERAMCVRKALARWPTDGSAQWLPVGPLASWTSDLDRRPADGVDDGVLFGPPEMAGASVDDLLSELS